MVKRIDKKRSTQKTKDRAKRSHSKSVVLWKGTQVPAPELCDHRCVKECRIAILKYFIYIYIYREWMWSSGLGRWT
jgi:hypothetical protein